MSFTPYVFEIGVSDIAHDRDASECRADLRNRIKKHIDRYKFGVMADIDFETGKMTLSCEQEPNKKSVERILHNWRVAFGLEKQEEPKVAPIVSKPERTLADRVLDAHKAVMDIEGSKVVDQATREELVSLLGELAEAARKDKLETQVQPCAGGAWHRRFISA